MFKNIGNKIRVLAKVICIIGFVVAGISGLSLIIFGCTLFSSRYTIGPAIGIIFAGLLVAALGALFAWVGSFVLYGYGQLIHSVQSIEKKVLGDEYKDYDSLPNTSFTGVNNSYQSQPSYKTCPYCNTANAANSSFCVGCGRNLN